ncbi:hypothetical protein BJ322DRAFT_1108563 [Thelephora terrestris]|uniref:DUF4470 domain-containing protein n=1 Tax=Thelephora terrestris TaxID=56493 RepID=A0A9P6HDS8_9AGAM|nr:hypothetical protein BJ322DRAFT_1108563 [Thelephora terrestris]
MVLPVLWPGSTFFYPVGNTSAVDLTDTLTPEEKADILLLGCGDPRHILFTVHNQKRHSRRTLDFTCCDVEPAILARNVLLLTMIADNRSCASTIDNMWNIFFHFLLDEESTTLLEAQCQKLLNESTSFDAWNQSPYSSFLRFCNEHTRLELRRHWQLYVDAGKLPPERKREIKDTFLSEMKKVRSKYPTAYPGSRSAGQYVLESMVVVGKVRARFWTTGTTFANEEAVSSARFINPTFVYSLLGTKFSVHFGTTPVAPFHLALAFLRPNPTSVTPSDLIECAKSQFRRWIASFRTFVGKRPGRIVIRFFCGEALDFCHALVEYRATGSVPEYQTVAPWNRTPLAFDGPDYTPRNLSAPLAFNVVETSNLTDYVGLLNVLTATNPLLSESHSATLFTETLLYAGNDPTKYFNRQLCADLTTVSVLINLLPTNYPSNFSSRSNVPEIVMHKAFSGQIPQYHERLSWRRPTTGDAFASSLNVPTIRPIAFDPLSLAKLLLNIFYSMFSCDDEIPVLAGVKPIAELSVMYYTRKSFVAFVATIKRVVDVDWETTMRMFIALLEKSKSTFKLRGFHYHQELCTQLYLAGITTVYAMSLEVAKQGRYRGWHRVPPTVSVTLVVPRERIQVLVDMDQAEISNTVMQASLQGESAYSGFASIKVGFGKVTNSGTVSEPRIDFDADPAGWAGSSPLVVSFSLPSWILLVEDPKNLIIALSLRLSPQIIHLVQKFGMSLHVFTAKLMDTSAVFVVPDEPHGVCHRLFTTGTPAEDFDGWKISATMDAESGRLSAFTARADIPDGPTRRILSRGDLVTSRQISPCTMELSIGSEKRQIIYPSPVVGTLSEFIIAEDSWYIEVIAPVAGKCGLNINPFPVSVAEKVEAPWNIHRLNLDALPAINISEQEPLKKLPMDLIHSSTDRELSLSNTKNRTDTLLNVKGTIQAILSDF